MGSVPPDAKPWGDDWMGGAERGWRRWVSAELVVWRALHCRWVMMMMMMAATGMGAAGQAWLEEKVKLSAAAGGNI